MEAVAGAQGPPGHWFNRKLLYRSRLASWELRSFLLGLQGPELCPTCAPTGGRRAGGGAGPPRLLRGGAEGALAWVLTVCPGSAEGPQGKGAFPQPQPVLGSWHREGGAEGGAGTLLSPQGLLAGGSPYVGVPSVTPAV